MTDVLVPRLLPVSTAALIAGRSPARIAALVNADVLRAERGCVVTASLEWLMDREITPPDYLRADRAREPAREYQRNYRNRLLPAESCSEDERRTA
jgi:hypothetical protein